MVPFVRTRAARREQVVELLAANGLKRGEDGLKVIMMCEMPTNALLADRYLEYFDGMSIGSNDMTQLTLGLDRDSAIIARLFDERDDAVKALLHMAIKACRKAGKYIGICGQGPSDHPDLARWLLDQGIESMSLNPDTVVETWLFLAGRARPQVEALSARRLLERVGRFGRPGSLPARPETCSPIETPVRPPGLRCSAVTAAATQGAPRRVFPGEHVSSRAREDPARSPPDARWRDAMRASTDRLPARERVGERAAVDVLELAADRHAVRDARRAQAERRRDLGQEMRRGLALDRGIGREDHFPDLAFAEQPLERVDADLVGADAVERRQVAHQHEVAAAVARRLLDRHDVGRRLDHAEQRAVAARRGADRAEFALGEHAAAPAVPERARSPRRRDAAISRAPSRSRSSRWNAMRCADFGPDARQAAQRLDQPAQRRRIEHVPAVAHRTAA